MSDVSHTKFITSSHSDEEDMEVPDLFYRHNEQFVGVYSGILKNKLISTVTTSDLNDIAGEQQLVIEHVLEATFRKKPILIIVTTTSKSTTDNFIKPRIYVFWHRILENNTKLVHFDLPMVGDISAVAMTSQPLVLVQKSTTEILQEKHLRHLLVLGKRDQSVQVALLHDTSNDHRHSRIRGRVTDLKLPALAVGDITAIHVLPQSNFDMRLGYSDPRIFVGTSEGYIQVLRFQALFRKQMVDGLHILHGYTWTDFVMNGNKPITNLMGVRAPGLHTVFIAVGQKAKANGDDNDSAHYSSEMNDDNHENNDITYLYLIEWPGNYHRKILAQLSPTKLSSFTLSSTRIIPTTTNHHITAVFQSTKDKQHFEIDIWTIEDGAVKLLVSDEIFEHDSKNPLEDIWPIKNTSGYVLLNPENASESGTTDIGLPDNDTIASAKHPPFSKATQIIRENELSEQYDTSQLLNNKPGTGDTSNVKPSDSTSVQLHGDDEQPDVIASDQMKIVMEDNDSTVATDDQLKINSSITKVVSVLDQNQTATYIKETMGTISNDVDESTPLIQIGHEERSDNEAVDGDSVQNQGVDGTDASDLLDSDFPDQNYREHQWRNDDTTVPLGDGILASNSETDMADSNNQEILDNDNTSALDFEDQTINSMVYTQQQENESGSSKIGTNGKDMYRESSHVGQGTTTAENILDIRDESENHIGKCSMNQGKQTIAKLNTAIGETTTKTGGSGRENDNRNNQHHHHHHHTGSIITHGGGTISIGNEKQSAVPEEDVTTHEIVAKETVTFNGDNSVPNEIFSREQRLRYIQSTSTIPYVRINDDGTLNNTTQHLCKLEQNDTGLGNNTSVTASSASDLGDIKSSAPSAICQDTISKEPPTTKMIYQAKVKKVTESSLPDGLNMVVTE
ncbi:hypothetical protein BCR42DRAFT_207954 [Absidia repens]|uniref:Uncharacterized protein n=1 Tax=Absidia repens TaxID=90262 RepID=A0A1X2IQ93_9FUNG|nr:hypothetical protein BCR42DRAFT_207954 [Absidia repens]